MRYPPGVGEAHATLTVGMKVTPSVHLVRPLGAGGMGAVWLADHLGLKTRVVVKFMLDGLDASTNARARFSREAAAAAQVKSPHVVQMLDHGLTDDGVPFIVMEYLEGRDLAAVLAERGALEPAEVVTIVAQVAKALSRVHAAGLLHRDIKPDNIFVCDGEDELFVKLLDFGIAKSHGEAKDGPLDGDTKTGQVVGTPFYMSPEQVTAQKEVDARSDLWSLAVVAFEALTGQRPFDGPSFGALAVKIATGECPKPSSVHPALPPSVDEWFARACAKNPADRFASAKELAEALREAFVGVVSLPPATSMSDSGSRGRSSDGGTSGERRVEVGSGPRSASPTFGLAPTIEEPAPAEALARSEPGSVVVGGGSGDAGRRGSRIGLFVLVAAVAAVGTAAIFVGRRASHEEPRRPGTALGAEPSATPSVIAPSAAFAASSEPTSAPDEAPSASASASASAAPVAAPSPTRAHAVPPPKPSARPAPSAATSPARPSADPPPPRPASSHDDPLF